MNKFITDTLYNIIRQLLNVLLGMLIIVIIARTLGPGGQGSYSLIILLPNMLTSFLSFGIGVSAAYYIGRKKYLLSTIYKTNIILGLVISLFITLIGLFTILGFKDVFFQEISQTELLIALIAVPLIIFKEFLQVIFQGLQDFKPFNAILIIGKIVNLIALTILLVNLKNGLIGAIIAFIMGELISVLIAQFILTKKYSLTIRSGSLSRNYSKDVLMFGLKSHLTNILALLNNRADMFMISFFLNPLMVGLYAISVNLSEKLTIITNAISTVLFPRISSLNTEDEKNRLTSGVTRVVMFFSIIVGLLVLSLSKYIILVIFGKEYIMATTSFQILLIGVVFMAVSKIIANDIAGRGKPELNMYVSFLLVTSNIILNLFLIPEYGIVGAAIATTLANLINFLCKIIIFNKLTKVPCNKFLIINKQDLEKLKLILKPKKILKGML